MTKFEPGALALQRSCGVNLKRMWINQPSASQPLHKLHGTRVLAHHEYGETYRIYFLDGDTISQQALRLWLSDGWPVKQPIAWDYTDNGHSPRPNPCDHPPQSLAQLGESFVKCRGCGSNLRASNVWAVK